MIRPINNSYQLGEQLIQNQLLIAEYQNKLNTIERQLPTLRFITQYSQRYTKKTSVPDSQVTQLRQDLLK
jgi:DNA-directed RNA polymerase specialized sigma subunit